MTVGAVLPIAAVVTGAVLSFGIGVVKSRWTRRRSLVSGLDVLTLAAIAGTAGYTFGTFLPALVGVYHAGTTAIDNRTDVSSTGT